MPVGEPAERSSPDWRCAAWECSCQNGRNGTPAVRGLQPNWNRNLVIQLTFKTKTNFVRGPLHMLPLCPILKWSSGRVLFIFHSWTRRISLALCWWFFHGRNALSPQDSRKLLKSHLVSCLNTFNYTVFAEINAHQKWWFFKGGGEYTKPMGFDGWFFKGKHETDGVSWVLECFLLFQKIKDPGRLFWQIR